MKSLKILFTVLFFTNCFNINCQLKEYLNKIQQYNWQDVKTGPNEYKLGLAIVNELNNILLPENILKAYKKVSDGYLVSNDNKSLIIDYSELFVDKIDFLAFYDQKKDILMVMKNGYLYFSGKNMPFKMKLNSLFFNSTDFEFGKYSIEKLISKIKNNLYNCPIIDKKEVFSYYPGTSNWWKRYFFNPNDELIMFKPDIEYDLKFEILVPAGKALPSKLLPLWQKYICQLKENNSPEFINNLISIPNFYEVWKERQEKWLNKPVELEKETGELIEKTKNDRFKLLTNFDKNNIFNLSKDCLIDFDSTNDILPKEIKYDIVTLNRKLLEETFPEECPKKLELKFIPENIIGDYDNSVSDSSASVLIERNLDTKIIIENNKEIKDIEDFSTSTKDKSQNRYYLNEYMKKIFSKTDLLTIFTGCNSNLVYDKNKNIVFNNNYNSNVLRTEFKDYYDSHGKIKSTIKLKYYYESLSNFFDKSEKDKVFEVIYKKMFALAFNLSAFTKSELFHNNKYYSFSDYEEITMIFIKLQFNYLKANLETIDFESENWEIPISFIKYDENVFSDYYLDYKAD